MKNGNSLVADMSHFGVSDNVSILRRHIIQCHILEQFVISSGKTLYIGDFGLSWEKERVARNKDKNSYIRRPLLNR